jgi:uncharacterized protein
VARSFFTRLRGLLGTSSLDADSGLWLEPCSSIHMFGMKYAIDAVFVDRKNKVVGLVENIQPGALSKNYKGARSCLELVPGCIQRSGTALGDELELIEQ